jgi:hypothetical protein
VAESSPLDNGVYDPKEQFLNSALNFASKLLLSLMFYDRDSFGYERLNAVGI